MQHEYECKRCGGVWQTQLGQPKACRWCGSKQWKEERKNAPGQGRPRKEAGGSDGSGAVGRRVEASKLPTGGPVGGGVKVADAPAEGRELSFAEEVEVAYRRRVDGDPEFPEERARQQAAEEVKRLRAERAAAAIKEDAAAVAPMEVKAGEDVVAKLRERFGGMGLKRGME